MDFEKTLLDGMAEDTVSLEQMLGMEEEKQDFAAYVKQIAESGDDQAYTVLGYMYLKGKRVEQDAVEALYWLEKSPEARAKTMAAQFYMDNGDEALAEQWYQKALSATDDHAGRHHCEAYYNLALINLTKDIEQAHAYLLNAGQSCATKQQRQIVGVIAGQLGQVFFRSKDDARAALWLRVHCDCAPELRPKAKEMLCLSYTSCIASKECPDDTKAYGAQWLEKHEEVLDDNAKCALYYYYLQKKPYCAAEVFQRWAEAAAEAGCSDAQADMAVEYLGEKYFSKRRTNVPMDHEKSMYYVKLLQKKDKLSKWEQTAVQFSLQSIEQENKAKTYAKYPEKHLKEADGEKILAEMKRSGSTVLVIPDGYTHVDGYAFPGYSKYVKILRSITEIRFPESMMYIEGGAFNDVCNLTKIPLPSGLRKLGSSAFDGTTLGLFNRVVKDKRCVEKLVIPANCEVAAGDVRTSRIHAFDGIYAIKEIVFEEGYKHFNWCMFEDNHVQDLYIPASVETFTKASKAIISNSDKFRIDRVHIPRSLRAKLDESLGFTQFVKEIIEY